MARLEEGCESVVSSRYWSLAANEMKSRGWRNSDTDFASVSMRAATRDHVHRARAKAYCLAFSYERYIALKTSMRDNKKTNKA